MDQIACARGLMQRVNVQRDGVNLAGMLALEPRQRDMRRVGPRIAMPPPAQIIEVVHTRWVAGKAFRRRHLLERGVSNMKLRNFLLVSVAVILSLLSTAAMADNCTWAPQPDGSTWGTCVDDSGRM
jgi:hypothetical protein